MPLPDTFDGLSIDILTIVGYAITLPLLWIGWRTAANAASPARRAVSRAMLVALLATPTLFGDPGLGLTVMPAMLVLLIAMLPSVGVAHLLQLVVIPILVIFVLTLGVLLVLQRRQQPAEVD